MSERERLTPGEINLGDDDGFVTITMGGLSANVDVWQANNRVAAAHAAHKDQGDEAYNEAMVGVVESFGFPRCSQRCAQLFVQAIQKRVKELAGNG